VADGTWVLAITALTKTKTSRVKNYHEKY